MENKEEKSKKDVKVIDTDTHKKHGANKCPKCGASDITYDIDNKKLKCNFCKYLFDGKAVNEKDESLDKLSGEIRSSSLKDIKHDDDVITLKCSNCQAKVVINTKESQNVRCHWCNSILSLNSQVDNGAVPDMILPFSVKKEEAENKIEEYISKRRFFADRSFKKDYKNNSVKGVYFPYLIVDSNAHGLFKGEAGEVARSYTKVVGKDDDGREIREKFYDIDVYEIEREFDITIDDLQIESSIDKLNKHNNDTNNIINSIMPFDTKNCVKYESNYLVGYTSEIRDVNVDDLNEKIDESLKDIARHSLNKDLTKYDGGVSWDEEIFDIKGKKLLSAYFPVWLYSYLDKKKILHYVAVNGRTGETIGSIPINKTKLILLSALIFILIVFLPEIIYMVANQTTDFSAIIISPLMIFLFIVAFIVSLIFGLGFYNKYRNKSARHDYETKTDCNLKIIKRKDNLTRRLHEESSSTISGVNSHTTVGDKIIVKNNKKKEE